MPSNKPLMEAGAPGQYHASGLWRAEVIIPRGGKTQSLFIDMGL